MAFPSSFDRWLSKCNLHTGICDFDAMHAREALLRALRALRTLAPRQYQSYVSEEEKVDAQTLTFTLPLKVPPGGAGLRVYDAYTEKSTGRLLNQEGEQLVSSGREYKQLLKTLAYEDVTYLPGRMLLFTGDQCLGMYGIYGEVLRL